MFVFLLFAFLCFTCYLFFFIRKEFKPYRNYLAAGSVLFTALYILAASLIAVKSGTVAVLYVNQKAIKVLREGLHVIPPFISKTEELDSKEIKYPENCFCATLDQQQVTVSIDLNYKIGFLDNDYLYLVRNLGLNYQNTAISPRLQQSVKDVVGRYTAVELTTKRSDIATKILINLSDSFKAQNYPFVISSVSLRNSDFSPEYDKAIEQKQVAFQNSEKQKYIAIQAELEAKTVMVKAKAEADSAVLRAAALKTSGGQALLAKEWIDKWDGKFPTVMSGSNSSVLLNLQDLKNSSVKQ